MASLRRAVNTFVLLHFIATWAETVWPPDYTGARSSFVGVPVYNYNPKPRRLGDPHKEQTWIISWPQTVGELQIATFCKNFNNSSGCKRHGHPSRSGLAFVLAKATEDELKAALGPFPGVDFIEHDQQVELPPNLQAHMRSSLRERTSMIPWGLDRIDARSGLDGMYTVPVEAGQGVHVYVLDTGIRTTHEDFNGRAVPTLETDGYDVWECPANESTCAMDHHGHGTHCAGTIGGTTYGVAKGAILHAVKTLDNTGRGSLHASIVATEWIIMHGQHPAVMSMSFGAFGRSPMIERALDAAVAANVVVVVAAGNAGINACSQFPANVASAITVGASDRKDQQAWFSNGGSCMDIFAPGVDITSAHSASDTAVMTHSGTSMACPHVAGVAALTRQREPNLRASDFARVIVDHGTHDALTLQKHGNGSLGQQDVGCSPNILLYSGADVEDITTMTQCP